MRWSCRGQSEVLGAQRPGSAQHGHQQTQWAGAEKGHLGSCSPRVPTEELEKNYPGETNRSPRGDLRPGTQHRGGSPDSQFICGVETGQEVYYNVICAASVSNELHLPGGSLNYSVK